MEVGSTMMEPEDMKSLYDSSLGNQPICITIGNVQSKGLFFGTNPLHYPLPLIMAQLSLSSMVVLLAYRLLKPLGQPKIVPQLLAALILGPSVLGQSAKFRTKMFPLSGLAILDALAALAYMFYFFLIGVQLDPWILKKIKKKDFAIGISTVALAILLSISSSFLLLESKISLSEKIAGSLPIVGIAESVLSFPMIALYLKELKIANSELGRVALSSSVISNLFSYCVMGLTLLSESESRPHWKFPMSKLSSAIVIAIVIVLMVRPTVSWMIRRTPEGEPLRQEYIHVILLGVLVAGFCSQASGLNILYGPLILGMVIPAGPPMGSTMVEKLDVFTFWILMPLYFVKNGLVVNIFSIRFKNYLVVQFIILIACMGKFLGAFLSSLYFSIPSKDAVSLGLLMNVQGVLELLLFKMTKRTKEIDTEVFSIMCTSLLIVAATISPIIRSLYNPSRRYAVYNKRTILNSTPNAELQVLACLHDQKNVPIIINLLEALNPTKQSPISVYIFHLVELVGRAHPLLVTHKLTKEPCSEASTSKSIVNAFRYLEQSLYGVISVYPFTAISPYATMHDEVCKMAFDKSVSLIIIPFHRRFTVSGEIESSKKGIRTMNEKILEMAPCSIAIIVDRGLLNSSRPMLENWTSYRVAVLFLGGIDDREALALGARMAGQTHVDLTVVRLLADGNVTADSTSEEGQLDNEVLSDFKLSMAGNYRVTCIEEMVMDGRGTLAIIKSMENNYELLIVGRHHDRQSPLLRGLTGWNEETELGEIGDLLASADFHDNANILVVQQHRNSVSEWQENANPHLFHEIEDETEELPIKRNAV